jgi:hypothetical protein
MTALPALGILLVAAWFEPSPTGLGTHSQSGLMPTCGWIQTMDTPCPTCGMTTAFAHAADGHLLASFLAQPMGCVLAVATAMALLLGMHAALTGSAAVGAMSRLWGRRTGWWLGAFIVIAWVYKIIAYKGLLE